MKHPPPPPPPAAAPPPPLLLLIVVTLKVSDIPPMVSVAFVVVEWLSDEVCCTVTVSPGFTVPSALVYDSPLMEYVPPVMEMGVVEVIPDTVMVFDVITVLNAASV
jgi:hypothetical protein